MKRISLRTLLVLVTCLAVCCAAYVGVRQSIVGRNHFARKLGAHIQGLHANRPTGLNAAQWECMVDWTANLHANSLIAFQTNTQEIAAFEARVGRKLSGPIDAATIEWIWDEYADVCPGGEDYQRFRFMVNESLEALNSPVLLEPPVNSSGNAQ